MPIDPSLVSLIAVITSAIVALGGALAPIWSLLLDRRKWERERKNAAIALIQQSASEVLELVADVQGYRYDQHNREQPGRFVAHYGAAPDAPSSNVYTPLMKKYYAWEVAVAPYCQLGEYEQLKTLRQALHAAAVGPGALTKNSFDSADRILTLSGAVIVRLM